MPPARNPEKPDPATAIVAGIRPKNFYFLLSEIKMSEPTELIQLSENIFLLPLPTNIGLIALKQKDSTTNIYLIDSGNDERYGKTVLETAESRFTEPRLKAVINTHSHADHCGANQFLKEKTGCQIIASTGEAAVMECPVLETGLIWGGMPVKELDTKYFTASACVADKTFKSGSDFWLEEKIHVQTIALKGHYIDQTGFLLTDTDGKKILFAGDALSGRDTIKKYWIQYLFNENQAKQSLHSLAKIEADFYVPGHGQGVTEIEGLVELNLLALLETENMILDELKTPKTAEQILQAVSLRNEIPLKLSQYVLIGCTLRSYLSALCDCGKIKYEIKDNLMFWSLV